MIIFFAKTFTLKKSIKMCSSLTLRHGKKCKICVTIRTFKMDVSSQLSLRSRRSSHWRCSVKKGVLKNLANFTGKHLCWSLFLIKLLFRNVSKINLSFRSSNRDVFFNIAVLHLMPLT